MSRTKDAAPSGADRSCAPEQPCDAASYVTTVGGVLEEARNILFPSRTAGLDAELLLAHVVDRPRSWILAHSDSPLTGSQLSAFKSLLSRRSTHEPLAYLRGYVDWYDFRLRVTPAVLIPRPETEVMLERTVSLARRHNARTIVDVGTGSGALAIGLARAIPDVHVLAVDTSQYALSVARDNVARHRLTNRVTLLHGSLLEPVLEQPDLVVANLPYLSDGLMRTRDLDTHHEPDMALYGGPSGLDLYEALLLGISQKGWRVPCALEIDPDQRASMETLVRAVFLDACLTVEKDYAGHDRILILEP